MTIFQEVDNDKLNNKESKDKSTEISWKERTIKIGDKDQKQEQLDFENHEIKKESTPMNIDERDGIMLKIINKVQPEWKFKYKNKV